MAKYRPFRGDGFAEAGGMNRLNESGNLCSLHCQAVGSASFGARQDVGEAEGLQGERSHSWPCTTCSVL